LIFQIFHVIINSNGINYPRCRLECCGGRLRGAVRKAWTLRSGHRTINMDAATSPLRVEPDYRSKSLWEGRWETTLAPYLKATRFDSVIMPGEQEPGRSFVFKERLDFLLE